MSYKRLQTHRIVNFISIIIVFEFLIFITLEFWK